MRKITRILPFLFALAILFTSFFAGGKSMVQAASVYPYQENFSYHNNATGYEAWIYDDAGFLSDCTDAEFSALVEEMKQVTQYANVAFVTTTSHSYYSTEQYCINTFDSRFGYGADGVIFAIDRDLNEIYLLSEGDAQKQISNSRCIEITDNTYIYATSSFDYDYYTCGLKTMQQVSTVLQGNRLISPLRIITTVFLAIALAFLVNYFIARGLSKPRKASRKEILRGTFTGFALNDTRINLINTTRRYIPPSSSGGHGGHGGGSHGGGGHSGGGGGHSHSGGGHRI